MLLQETKIETRELAAEETLGLMTPLLRLARAKSRCRGLKSKRVFSHDDCAPAFMAYELYSGTESWFDRITWERTKHAEDGRNTFLTTEITKQMIPLVEGGYISFFGKAVASV